jgi:hypothetical protein
MADHNEIGLQPYLDRLGERQTSRPETVSDRLAVSYKRGVPTDPGATRGQPKGDVGHIKTGAATLAAMTPEVTPEDLAKYNDEAIMLAYDLAPGESAMWANLVNTAASMGEIHNEQADGPS